MSEERETEAVVLMDSDCDGQGNAYDEPADSECESKMMIEEPLGEKSTNAISLRSPAEDILSGLEKAETVDEMKEFTRLFHLSLAKKEAARALTQSELVDELLKQAGDRIRLRPDEMTHKDLLDYLNAFQSAVDKSTKGLDAQLADTPPLTLNQTNQEININIGGGKTMAISDDSRLRILDVINALTKGKPQRKTIREESDDVAVGEPDKDTEEHR